MASVVRASRGAGGAFPGRPGARPQQDRSRQARDRILVAAAEIAHREGAPGFTVQRVAAQAEVAVASIYRYFVDKDGLVHATQDHVLAAIHDNVERRVRAAAPTIEAVVATFVASAGFELQTRARAINAFITLGHGNQRMIDRASRSHREGVAGLHGALRPQWDRIAHDNRTAAVRLAYTFAITPSLHYAQAGAGAVPDAEPLRGLYPEIARACIGYLVQPYELSADITALAGPAGTPGTAGTAGLAEEGPHDGR